MLLCVKVAMAVTAYNGTVTRVITDGKNVVYKITLPAGMSADETVKFGFTGTITQVVIVGTTTDADGDITASDISGTFLTWLNPIASSATVRYVATSTDSSSNVYGGIPVAGTLTWQITAMAAAEPVNIYVYCVKD